MVAETNSTIFSFNNAHHFISIKLTPTNYLFWRTQITLFLEGHNLLGFVDDSHQRPHPTDPNYAQWIQQDKLIMSLLVASLSEDVFPLVIGLETSYHIWITLEKALEVQMSTQNIIKDTKLLGDDDRKLFETHLIVATLIATVTFAAGFTVPGGYDGNEGPNQGMAVLARKAAFQAFVVSDTIAVVSSIAAVFLHFVASIYLVEDETKAATLYGSASLVTIIAMIAMAVAFITGLYTVLAPSSLGLAISVCFFGSFGVLIFLWVLYSLFRFALEKLRSG